MSLLPVGFGSQGGEYTIEESLRFNASQSSYLTRTWGTPTNNKIWTYSCWVKLGDQTNYRSQVLSSGITGSPVDYAQFQFVGALNYQETISSASALNVSTVAVFRDYSAWYHVVLAVDTTQATATDRIKIYVNGALQTLTIATQVAQNTNTTINKATRLGGIGALAYNGSYINFSDGYKTEVNFIDGQALDASSFGEFDAVTGVWKPKEYTGTYGTNGFYLPMKLDNTVEGFNTVTYIGNGSTQQIGGAGFSPDLVWIKSRTEALNHAVFDSVRGATQYLSSNTTTQENSYSNTLTSFNTDGFSVGNSNGVNDVGDGYVAWCWDAGSSTVSNTDGSITSSVRANPTYGFSVATLTAQSSGTGTFGHGLGVAPSMVITKLRAAANAWATWHISIPNTQYLELNTTNAAQTAASYWNSTSPTSTVVSLGSAWAGAGTMVAYCFSEVSGYSKFGSYTGTGASGNAVTTGFKPAFVMIKRTDLGDSWALFDSTRDSVNPIDNLLYAERSDAEGVNTFAAIAFTDTGFTVNGIGSTVNNSGGTYIYMAFKDTREYAFWLDDSGNNNDWQPNGGITTNSTVTDTPTPYADGGNYCVWNAVAQSTVVNGTVTRSNANLTSTDGGTTYGLASFGTIAVTTGKWYWETTLTTAGGTYANIGVVDLNSSLGAGTHTGIVYAQNGTKNTGSNVFASGGGGATYGASYTAGDVIGVALDLTTGTITFYKNGTSQGVAYTGISGNYTPAVGDGQNAASYTFDLNCGQRPFAYTPPTGFLPLHTGNLPDSAIVDGSEYFDVVTRTGTGAEATVTGLQFQPDLLWTKTRSNAVNHSLTSTGLTYNYSFLQTNTTEPENTSASQYYMIPTADGYTVGTGDNINQVSRTFVDWVWKANGAGVSNTDGSITSTVSANTTAGFSVVTFVNASSTNQETVGHGLGAAPKLIISKNRDTSANNWAVFHASVCDTTSKFLKINTTDTLSTYSTVWGAALPTSTVFGVTGGGIATASVNVVAYCFADVEGYSKFGSYTGNGSADGPFVYTGFRPAFVMYKRTDSSGTDWVMVDTARDTYNVANKELYANGSYAEGVVDLLDFTSNGFKCRRSHSSQNASGGTYIYMAFAETDFAHALAR